MNDDDIARLVRTNAAQIQKLQLRLGELGVLDVHDNPDEEIGIAFANNLKTGEIVVAIDLGESMYWEQGTQLIEQQERPDGLWYRHLGDGQPAEDWQRVGPPPLSRSSLN